jgi:predicted MFS family arabinose efflux permease
MTLSSKLRNTTSKYLAVEKSIRVLLITSVLKSLGVSLWEPLLGLYITGNLGVSLILFGLMTTIRQLTQSLTSFPSGFLSDNFGRKKMITLSLAFSILALVSLFVTKSLPLLFFVSIFRGLSMAFIGPSKSAYIIDVIPVERRGVAFSTLALFESLSSIIAVSLAGIIANVHGFMVVFGVAFVFEAASLIGILLYLQEPLVKPAAEKVSRDPFFTQLKNGLTILKYPPFLAVLIGIMFHMLGLGIEGPYLTIYARNILLFSLPAISLMLGIQRLGILLGQFPSGRIVDKFSGEISFAFHIFVTTPVMMLFTIMGNPLLASSLLFTWGLTFGLDNVSRQKLTAKYRASSGIATAFGIIGLISGLVSLFTPTIGGWIWTNFSPQLVFYVAATANFIGPIPLFMLWVYNRKKKN